MDNLKLPAYPLLNYENAHGTPVSVSDNVAQGFTKLELASLMIAQGMANDDWVNKFEIDAIAKRSVLIAKAVLDQANK